MIEVELAVIGSGSGNAVVGKEWAGRRVAIVDDATAFGGTCLNRGCIPTKMLVHPANVVADVADGIRLGIEPAQVSVDWPALRDRVFGRTDEISEAGERWRQEQDSVTVVREAVRFVEPRTLETAGGERIRAEHLVIAAGSRPRDIDGVDPSLVHTSDTVMRIDTLPSSMIIAGGGAIATELAHVFSSFGVAVTMVVRGSRLLSREDEVVADCYTELAKGRWQVRTGVTIAEVQRGRRSSHVTLNDGTRIKTGLVLNATGRVPNTDRLGAGELFDLHDDGRIVTDRRLRVLAGGVPVDGVWALGDVTSEHQLKHVANHQARVVRANLRGEGVEDRLEPVPQAIFAGPEVASFGTRSQDAPPGAVVVTRDVGSTAYGWAMEDESSFVTLVVGREGRILGAHILGPHASMLLQPLVQAASAGRTVHGLARSMYWPHPALTEVVENALLDAEKALASAEGSAS